MPKREEGEHETIQRLAQSELCVTGGGWFTCTTMIVENHHRGCTLRFRTNFS